MRRPTAASGALLLLALAGTALPAPAADPPAPAAAGDPEVTALLDAVDDVSRGSSSTALLRMTVRTAHYERTLRLRLWTRGTDRSLVVVEDPPRERGTATLRVGDDIWNYLPRVDRTIRVPASMMSGSWMGSHFTNDDLVKESRMARDYAARVLERPGPSGGAWKVELVPRPDAPVVWGRVVVEADADRVPRRIAWYDEDGTLVRTMTFTDVRTVDGRRVPMRMRVEPADRPGEYTEVVYEELHFDVEVPDERFTLQALRR